MCYKYYPSSGFLYFASRISTFEYPVLLVADVEFRGNHP